MIHLEPREQRDSTIHVRVSPAERQRAEEAAEAAGVLLSDVVRAGLQYVTSQVLNRRREESGAT